MSLPPMSKKRAAAIADGTFKPNPRKPLHPKCITAKEFAALKTKAKKPTKARAKKRAWDWFSKFIRLRDSDEYGRAKCITCKAVKHWKELDAGHYITRAKESTLFDERNVSAQCGGCNRWQGGKFLEHGMALDAKFGPGTKNDIELKAMRECKRTLNDYLFLEETYRARVLNMAKVEPERVGPL